MTELKPCPNPNCGCKTPKTQEGTRLEIICPDCLLTLPAPLGSLEWLIDQWNSLPRALTWTTEPPTIEHVGTWFWSLLPGQNIPLPVIVAELDGVLGIGRGTSEQGLTMEICREFGVRFAGSIQAPAE